MISYLNKTNVAKISTYDFSIIGGGAAGISLAIELGRLGKRVVLFEAGDYKVLSDLEDLYKGEASKLHPATNEFRYQRLGGTTHLWGGRCLRLDPCDFEKREYIPQSGWPIEFNDLNNFYKKALIFCDAGEADFSVNALRNSEPMFPELPELWPQLEELIERYSLPTDFGKKFKQELKTSDNILVLLKAKVTGLNLNETGSQVTSINVHDGQDLITLPIKHLTLSGGGIETTRLMLATQKKNPSWGRFNNSLGKYYACHYDLIFGSVIFKAGTPNFELEKTKDGVYARRKLQFSPAVLNEHKLLNSTFRLHFPAYSDASHGSGVLSTIYLAKSILASEHQYILNHGEQLGLQDRDLKSHLKNTITDFDSVIKFGFDWLFKRQLATRKLPYTLVNNKNGSYPLEFNSEQTPDKHNQISLINDVDKIGMERVKVDWRMTSQDIDSGIRSFLLMQKVLNNTDNCKVNLDERNLERRVASALPVGGHHIGSTRMGVDARDSVVDQNCCVHGVNNLFINSSSVFSTNGHANPTLTIVALSLRLADYLKKLNF